MSMTDVEVMKVMLEEASEAGLDMEADLSRLEHELRKNGLVINMLEEGIFHAVNVIGEDEEGRR